MPEGGVLMAYNDSRFRQRKKYLLFLTGKGSANETQSQLSQWKATALWTLSSSMNSLFAIALSIYFSLLKSSLLVARELYMVCDGWGPQIQILCWPWISPFLTFIYLFFWCFWTVVLEKTLKKFIYFNWRLITLQYCSGFCHTLTWIRHGYICVPHPELPSHLSPHPIPQGHPSAPALSTLSHAPNLDWCYFTYDNIQDSMLFSQIIPPSPSPTESKILFFTSVSLLLYHI